MKRERDGILSPIGNVLEFGCIESTYPRKLAKDNEKLKFIQVTSQKSGFLIARVKSASGYYRVLAQTNGIRVEYYQTVELEESFLLPIYQSYARTSTKEFIQDLYEYLQTTIK